jgi:hypothetical protein
VGPNQPWALENLIYDAVKHRFFIFFLSLYHPNNCLENISISYFTLFNSVAKKNYSLLEKILGGGDICSHPLAPPKLCLRAKASSSSKTLVHFYQAAWCRTPEISNLSHCHENLLPPLIVCCSSVSWPLQSPNPILLITVHYTICCVYAS